MRKTMIWADYIIRELGFPAGFQVVKLGFCSGSKEAVRTSQEGERAVNYQRSLRASAGALSCPGDIRSRSN